MINECHCLTKQSNEAGQFSSTHTKGSVKQVKWLCVDKYIVKVHADATLLGAGLQILKDSSHDALECRWGMLETKWHQNLYVCAMVDDECLFSLHFSVSPKHLRVYN